MNTLQQSVGLLSVLTGRDDLTAATSLSELDSLTIVEWMFAMEDELELELDMEKADALGPDETVGTAVAAIVVT